MILLINPILSQVSTAMYQLSLHQSKLRHNVAFGRDSLTALSVEAEEGGAESEKNNNFWP